MGEIKIVSISKSAVLSNLNEGSDKSGFQNKTMPRAAENQALMFHLFSR
jgi:hypothetical protein